MKIMPTPDEAEPLTELRAELDLLDQQILAALGQRFAVCRSIAERKRQHGIALMQPGRMQLVQDRAVAAARKHGFDEAFAGELYRLIIAEACRQEEGLIEAAN
jgi:4-amino-4-deoxychorismate mutase